MRKVELLFLVTIMGVGAMLAQPAPASISLTISTRHPVVRLGAPIRIELAVKNLSDAYLDLSFSSPFGLGYEVSVASEQGMPARLTDAGRAERGG